jgi:hypothetical protein
MPFSRYLSKYCTDFTQAISKGELACLSQFSWLFLFSEQSLSTGGNQQSEVAVRNMLSKQLQIYRFTFAGQAARHD